MKKLIAVYLAAVLFGTGRTTASTFEVTSQQYHIWGQYHTVDFANNELNDSYDITSQDPVSGSVWHDNEIYGFSSADLLLVNAGSCAHRQNKFDIARASGKADADWIFSPKAGYSELELRLDVFRDELNDGLWHGDPITVQLEDLTSGSQLFYYNGTVSGFANVTGYPVDNGQFAEAFSIDPTHQYHMYTYMESTADADGLWFGSIGATIIPEPSVVLLLGLGSLILRSRN